MLPGIILLMSVAAAITYEYPLADTLHAANPRIKADEQAHNPFTVSTDLFDIRRMMSPQHIAHYIEEPATEFIKEKCGRVNFKQASSSVFDGLKEVSREKDFLTRLKKLSSLLRREAEDISRSFATALSDKMKRMIPQDSFDSPAPGFIQELLGNFQNSLLGAFHNAFATTLGLAHVLAKKFPAPKVDKDGAFAKYKKEFSTLLNRNVFLLRNIARFHFDLQNLFQNTNGITNKNRCSVFEFKPENFVLETVPASNKKRRLNFSPSYLEELKTRLQDDDLTIFDYDRERKFNFNTPARACPTLELDTEHGNFFNKFAIWINSFVAEILLTENNEQ